MVFVVVLTVMMGMMLMLIGDGGDVDVDVDGVDGGDVTWTSGQEGSSMTSPAFAASAPGFDEHHHPQQLQHHLHQQGHHHPQKSSLSEVRPEIEVSKLILLKAVQLNLCDSLTHPSEYFWR